MKLTLAITSHQKTAMGAGAVRIFDQNGGKIGRRADSDWMIADPDKILSGCHAEIIWEKGEFLVKDTSTNGLFLNGSDSPLGKDNVSRLSDGDSLRMGEYTMQVSLENLDLAFTEEASPNMDSIHDDTGLSNRGFDPLSGLTVDSESEIAKNKIISESDHSDMLSDPFSPPALNLDSSLTSPSISTGGIPEDWDLDDEEANSSDQDFSAEVMQGSTAGTDPTQEEVVDNFDSPRENISESVVDVVRAEENPGDSLSGATGADITLSDKVGNNEPNVLLLQGLMDLLAARMQLKNEFRLEMTTVKPSENNPLKFSASAQDALELFSKSSSSSYLPLDSAIIEGLEDIKNHQFAMMAAMRVAFERLVERLDPSKFKTDSAVKKSRIAAIALGEEKQNWQRYENFYKEMISAADDPFQELFGREFASAYEDFALRASLNISGESDQ